MNWRRTVEDRADNPPPVPALPMLRRPEDGGLRLHTDPKGRCPDIDPDRWDICLTTRPDAPRPWVVVADTSLAATRLTQHIAAVPVAARIGMELLRDGEGLDRERRLRLESLAYSALQGGAEFRRWLAARPAPPCVAEPAEPVRYEREGDRVTLRLADPASRNAYSAAMRDGLISYLDTCLLDPTRPHVHLAGEGDSFCTGGALEEFGLAGDPAAAHLLRMETSAVVRLWALGKRTSAFVHGPVIGSGLEIAAAAHHVKASASSWFQLPELKMGLLPGAGGTVTVTDRIGRHRTAWLMLSGQRIRASQALHWGLIDAIAGG